MSKIAEAIGSIVEKKLNGLLLDAAQNGSPILAAVGIGKGGASNDPATSIGDEVFTESFRKDITTQIISTDDPSLHVDIKQPIRIVLKSKEGRTIDLNWNPPTQP